MQKKTTKKQEVKEIVAVSYNFLQEVWYHQNLK